MQVDCLLDGHLCAQVRSDLGHRSRLMLVHGRQWTSAEVLLRLVVIQHLYIWSYQETVEWVTASLMLCSFCRVCFQQVPTKATLLRWASAIQRDAARTD